MAAEQENNSGDSLFNKSGMDASYDGGQEPWSVPEGNAGGDYERLYPDDSHLKFEDGAKIYCPLGDAKRPKENALVRRLKNSVSPRGLLGAAFGSLALAAVVMPFMNNKSEARVNENIYSQPDPDKTRILSRKDLSEDTGDQPYFSEVGAVFNSVVDKQPIDFINAPPPLLPSVVFNGVSGVEVVQPSAPVKEHKRANDNYGETLRLKLEDIVCSVNGVSDYDSAIEQLRKEILDSSLHYASERKTSHYLDLARMYRAKFMYERAQMRLSFDSSKENFEHAMKDVLAEFRMVKDQKMVFTFLQYNWKDIPATIKAAWSDNKEISSVSMDALLYQAKRDASSAIDASNVIKFSRISLAQPRGDGATVYEVREEMCSDFMLRAANE